MADLSRNPNLSDSAVRVGVYLCDCENDKTGQCNPAIAWIARDTNLSKRSIQYAINALADAGYIKVSQKGNGKGNRTEYELTKGANNAPIKGADSAPLENQRVQKRRQRVQKRHAKGAKNDIPLHPLCREPVKGTSERTGEVTEGGAKKHPSYQQKIG